VQRRAARVVPDQVGDAAHAGRDRSAIVTGASAGIGLAMTRALLQDGFTVTMAARDEARLLAAADQLGELVDDAATAITVHPGDAGDPEAVDDLVAAHLARSGRLDVVVANAGTGTKSPTADTRQKDLERMTRVNVYGPFALARATLPALRACAAEGGSPWFVVTSSLAGVWPMTDFAAYSATKGVGLSLARSISAEEHGNGVRACAICPAFVDTDMTSWVHDAEGPTAMLSPDDVAEAMRFLLRLSPSALVPEIVIQRAGAPAFVP
jgi:3-oxoacyl-[acyl-carrier protein] reductase